MPCLHKYWLKEFFKLFLSIQFIILILFVFIEYLSMLDKFLSSDITLIRAFWFVLLEVPFMFVQVTPAGVLLANIVVFSLMNKNNELLALRSSGVTTYSMLKPCVYSAAFIMLAMYGTGEIIVPAATIKAHDIELNTIKNKKNMVLDKKNLWIRSGKNIIHFGYYNPATRSVSGIIILSMKAQDFKPAFRLDASTGYYEEGFWTFENSVQQVYDKSTDGYDISNNSRLKLALDLKPEDLGQLVKKSEEMSLTELKRYVNKVRSEGYDATTYLVDLHGKIAFPFICMIMALAGAATGMKSFARKSIPKAVTVGIIFSFFYWVFYGIGISLGYGKFLPPSMAAWITNLIFFTLLLAPTKIWRQ